MKIIRRKPTSTYHHGNLKNSLVRVAAEIIQKRKGPVFTLRELAGRLRVSHAAAYRHFPDKESLLAAIAEEGFRLLYEVMLSAERKYSSDPLQVLQAKGIAYVKFATEHPGHFRVMFGPDTVDKSKFPSLLQTASGTLENLRRTIIECQDKGLIHPKPIELSTIAAWALVHGISSLLIDHQLPGPSSPPLQMSPEQLMQSVSEIFLWGLRKSDP